MSTKPNGIVEAGTNGIVMLPGYQDKDGDFIDGPDGNNDIIYTKNGDNYVDAGQGDDLVVGGTGNDTILGNDGDDTLFGGKKGDDDLQGGDGDDVFFAAKKGEDTMSGGTGRDTYMAGGSGTGGSGTGGSGTGGSGTGGSGTGGSGTGGSGTGGSGTGGSGTGGSGTGGSGTGGSGSLGSKFKSSFGTKGIDVTVNDDGFGTVFKQKSGETDTVESVENFIAPENKNGEDSITLTTPVDSTDVVGLDDNSVGTFTLPGGGLICFGPAQDYKLSDILNGTSPGGGNPAIGPLGSYQIVDGDEDGMVGNISFANFETINFTVGTDGTVAGPVDGLNSGENMGPGYTDLQGDMIDGSDGDDDTIFGNGGDDTIDSGVGDDTVDGGAGDDVFAIKEEGNGIDNDVIIGGETDEDNGGDVLDASDIGDDLFLNISAPEEGTLTDGTDTTEFEEIENFILGAGDDTVRGSDGDDNVDAGDGDNDIEGGDGDDTLKSGSGDDTIDGGDGDDSIDSGGGDDSITGGDGSDTVNGGNGNNVINTSGSSPRPDIAYPGLYTADTDPDDDRDLVTTGSGNDHITTGDDADTISSGAGNDTINAGIDDDVIDAGSGDDSVIGGEGNDSILGGDGNDTLFGGLGDGFPDAINIADDGSDPFGPDLAPGNGKDTIDGGRGNDLIYGQDDDDLLFGGNGADTIDGGKDNDTIYGGAGKDDITGGQGADLMFGEDDRDEFFINTRTDAFGDTVDGGTGSTSGDEADDFDTLDLRGLGKFEVVGETVDADGNSTSGTIQFLDGAGNVEGTLIFKEIEKLVVCFTPGTQIGTARGEIPVEMLRIGDRVVTRDNGVQEIRWVGHKTVGHSELLASPEKQPVLVRKGSLGKGLPERDMMLSPNHKLLVANDQSALYFEEREVLAAAKHLVHNEGISQLKAKQVTYIHFMFDHHEVVLSDGTWTESFQPGDYSLAGIDTDQREEIYALFPELRESKGLAAYGAARNTLKRHEAELLSF